MRRTTEGFRLLVPGVPASSSAAIQVSGQSWVLREAAPESEYTCVSYAWGDGRAPHPFESERRISDRALHVLEAVVRTRTPRAIWIDALCMPSEGPARAATLRGLGAIYGGAAEVVVVLSAASLPLFERYEQRLLLDVATLQALEQEAWVSRAWTYQELAKNANIRFCVERGSSVSIEGSELLNCLGHSLLELDKGRPDDAKPLFPALQNLSDVLAAWMYGGTTPFAYQVLAGMAERSAENPADQFNAVLGAIALSATDETSPDLTAASAAFIRACESKGDLSFIYTNAPRCVGRGQSWRPVPGALPPILVWHTYGEGQRGSVESSHVRLDDLCLAESMPLESYARTFISEWLADFPTKLPAESLEKAVLQQLQAMGFAGTTPPIECASGYFYPLHPQEAASASHTVLISTQVRWLHGAPALLVGPISNGRHRFRCVGVFVGKIPTSGAGSFEIE